MRTRFIFIIGMIFFINGCSVQKLAVRSMGGILDNAMTALYEEQDLQIAEQAIASDLKLLEGLIKTDPGNEHLLLLASQGFGAYALGFAEDSDPERARLLYLRGRDYGMQVLKKNSAFEDAVTGTSDQFAAAMGGFDTKDVPALFWTAYSWAGWINLSFTDPQALVELPKAQTLMQRVLQLDESYFFGGAHLFFGTIYSARPPLLGGNMEKAKYHFDKCFAFADNKFLLPYVYFARYYATREFDQELFENTLNKVLETPDDILSDQNLPNAIAKNKARRLLTQVEDFF